MDMSGYTIRSPDGAITTNLQGLSTLPSNERAWHPHHKESQPDYQRMRIYVIYHMTTIILQQSQALVHKLPHFKNTSTLSLHGSNNYYDISTQGNGTRTKKTLGIPNSTTNTGRQQWRRHTCRTTQRTLQRWLYSNSFYNTRFSFMSIRQISQSRRIQTASQCLILWPKIDSFDENWFASVYKWKTIDVILEIHNTQKVLLPSTFLFWFVKSHADKTRLGYRWPASSR